MSNQWSEWLARHALGNSRATAGPAIAHLSVSVTMATPLKAPTAEEVDSIGSHLGLRLHPDYAQSLIRYPFPLDSDLAEHIFYPSPAKVIETNEYFRKDGFYGHAWPEHFLIIGGMGNFDLLFLDTTRDDSAVFVADHELSSSADHLVFDQFQNFLLPECLEVILQGWKEIREHGP